MSTRALSLAAALLAAACGPRAEPAFGVTHLVLVGEDGRPTTPRLLAERGVVRELAGSWSFGTPADAPLADGELTPDFAGSLQTPLALAAHEVDLVEVDLELPRRGPVYLQWRPEAALGEDAVERDWPAGHYLAATAAGGGAETLVFRVGGHPDWRGAVGRLRVSATAGRLTGLRLVRVGFLAGDEPTHRELGPEGTTDGGLVALGLDARRSWPAEAGAVLRARVRVPRGGRLRASVALTHAAARESSEARVELEAGGSRRELARLEVGAGRWHEVDCDLSAWAGRDVVLALTVGEPRAGEPPRARALWAVPRVVGELAEDRRPDLVLVTLDTTRADAVGEGRRTPALDRLARGGLTFTNAFAPTNSTQPSHVSLLSGFAQQDHGVADNFSRVPPEVTTVTERLRGAGYLTAAAVSQPCLGLGTGLAQGFDLFHQPGPAAHLDGRETVAAAKRVLAAAADAPLFLWVHLYDPHTPYAPPDDFAEPFVAEHGLVAPPRRVTPPTFPEVDVLPPDQQFLLGTTNVEHARFLYGLGVSFADRLLGELVGAVEDAGRAGETAWVVTADHGESLGERESYFNHLGLYPETTRVPLVVRVPEGAAGGGRELDALVSGTDVAPTLLQLGGIFDRLPGRGRSLLRTAADGGDDERVVWFEHASGHQVGATDGRWYFVATLSDSMTFGFAVERDAEGRRVAVVPEVPAGRRELYDLRADPELSRDVSESEPEVLARFEEALGRWRESAGGLEGAAREMTPEEERELSDLGYAGQR